MLLAFVVPATIAPERIVTALSERLPAYMLPSIVTGLDALPLTASGKVDRQALLAEHAGRAPIRCGSGFSSDTARQVAQVWEARSEEHTSELQSLMRISYAVFCLKKKKLY